MPAPSPASHSRADLAAAARARQQARRALAEQLAADHDGVLTRAMLLDAGMSRGQLRTQVERGVLTPLGRHTLSVTGRAPTERALWWRALWESGRSAMLDGVTALMASGLSGWTEPLIHVTVGPKAHVLPVHGVRHHVRRHPDPSVNVGLRRTKPAFAVIRAAQWAATDRQAATLVAMSVQQRLARPGDVLDVWRSQRRTRRRVWLETVIRDVCDGAHSLAELDFASLCRARGLPEPTRQALRTGQRGRLYLDVFWEDYGVHVEIQGIHHTEPDAIIADALRFNDIGLRTSGVISLQIPVWGLRLTPAAFLEQVERALDAGLRCRWA